MTEKHPITPPPELVSKWCYEDGEEIKSSPRWFFSVCAKAAQWGADQELEACCELMDRDFMAGPSDLRAARRPKPPSLKQRALEAMHRNWNPHNNDDFATISRALEQLDD